MFILILIAMFFISPATTYGVTVTDTAGAQYSTSAAYGEPLEVQRFADMVGQMYKGGRVALDFQGHTGYIAKVALKYGGTAYADRLLALASPNPAHPITSTQFIAGPHPRVSATDRRFVIEHCNGTLERHQVGDLGSGLALLGDAVGRMYGHQRDYAKVTWEDSSDGTVIDAWTSSGSCPPVNP